jgi:hypothetical protein
MRSRPAGAVAGFATAAGTLAMRGAERVSGNRPDGCDGVMTGMLGRDGFDRVKRT